MIEVVIDNEVKQINTELTIGQYQRISKEKNTLNSDRLKLLSIVLDIPEKELRTLPKNQVDFFLTYVMQLLNENMEKQLVLVFEHDGKKYGLENDWSKLAWGAWEDFEILSAENIEQNIAHIMAILYREVTEQKGEKYKIVPYDADKVKDNVEVMLNVPVKYWFGAATFFFQIAELYITDLRDSLSLKNKMNRLKLTAWKKLPKFLQRKLPLDSILDLPSNSPVKILPK